MGTAPVDDAITVLRESDAQLLEIHVEEATREHGAFYERHPFTTESPSDGDERMLYYGRST